MKDQAKKKAINYTQLQANQHSRISIDWITKQRDIFLSTMEEDQTRAIWTKPNLWTFH